MRTVSAIDSLNWKIEEKKEGNKNTTLICCRKYLDEALVIADESHKYIKLYNEVFEHFKELVPSKIETTSTGEYKIVFDNANSWYHRNKNIIMQSFYEFTLKRVCMNEKINFNESLKRVHAMSVEDLFKK